MSIDKILLVSAARFEISDLKVFESLRDRVEYFEIGVGALLASKRSFLLEKISRGRQVIFVGTCGVYGNFSGVHLVRAISVSWLPTCVRHDLGYQVPAQPDTFDISKSHLHFESLPPAEVICTPTVSLDSGESLLHESAMSGMPIVENLELYSILPEAMTTASSFTAILGVTNRVCRESHDQWLQNHKEAAQLSGEILGGYFSAVGIMK
jgi:hypothetical protein